MPKTPTLQEQLIEEWKRMKRRQKNVVDGGCAICGKKADHDKTYDGGWTFTHQFDGGIDAMVWVEEEWLNTAFSKLLKAREEEMKLAFDKTEKYFALSCSDLRGRPVISKELFWIHILHSLNGTKNLRKQKDFRSMKKKTIPNMLQDDEVYQKYGMDGVRGYNRAIEEFIDKNL